MDPIHVKYSGLVQLKTIGDISNGFIRIGEGNKDVPFDVKRFYFISDIGDLDKTRGEHSHKETSQVIFCIKGSFTLHLDDGELKQDIVMNDPGIGVVLGPKLWHSMFDFSDDCMIFVLADRYYAESDYIRSYDLFKEQV